MVLSSTISSIFWYPTKFLAQLLVTLYPPVWVFWFVFHTRISHWRTMGTRAYWYACAGWPLIGIPVLYFRRDIFQTRWATPGFVIATGILALLLAYRFGSLAARTISRRTLIGLVELEPQKNPQPLMQSGVYRKTRNPIYLTHWLVIFSAASLSGYVANWLLLAVDCVLLPWMIRVEEKELSARYGAEFGAYMKSVPRFFPRSPW